MIQTVAELQRIAPLLGFDKPGELVSKGLMEAKDIIIAEKWTIYRVEGKLVYLKAGKLYDVPPAHVPTLIQEAKDKAFTSIKDALCLVEDIVSFEQMHEGTPITLTASILDERASRLSDERRPRSKRAQSILDAMLEQYKG